MALFKKKPDAMSLSLALAEDYGRGDETAIARSREALAPVKTMDILVGLMRFGQIIAPKLRPEQQEIVRQELAAAEGPPPLKTAVQQVGSALFITGQQDAVTTAVNAYFQPLLSSTGDGPRRAIFAIIAALGRICVKCDIKMNWG